MARVSALQPTPLISDSEEPTNRADAHIKSSERRSLGPDSLRWLAHRRTCGIRESRAHLGRPRSVYERMQSALTTLGGNGVATVASIRWGDGIAAERLKESGPSVS